MHVKDFAALVLSFVAIYLALQNEGAVSFRKSWCVLMEPWRPTRSRGGVWKPFLITLSQVLPAG